MSKQPAKKSKAPKVSLPGRLLFNVTRAYVPKKWEGRDRMAATLNNKAAEKAWTHSQFKAKVGYQVETVTLPQSVAYWLQPERLAVQYDLLDVTTHQVGQKFPRQIRAILHLHGGSYVFGLSWQYVQAAYDYSAAAGGVPVLTLDYRTAPQFPYPAALNDAVDAFNWLVAQGFAPSQIAVTGDSAGGGLALALALKLRDEGADLPGALVLLSPWTDLLAEGASYQVNAGIDPIFGTADGQPGHFPVGEFYVGKANPADPYISPVNADFTGLPRTMILASRHELLFSDAVQVARAMRSEGVDVTFHSAQMMIHVWPVFFRFLPESKVAWRKIGDFF
ncbi:hypothetical protein BK816_00715 [Boudabousia tangfeifanii]|uniref:Alpha/beta hydrolase fold-3 domain-containing protein n=1 Tax=Boudabousia tangfeifanii TaxID=1912795 RepID=A0A1D9MIG1_9ACTO|nr:alpha/beta hydrolase fold domain-containing protein [Boudabousia tangfeifanii]AOZ71998.1 hypothetical protein BK816_00715 [Boudabousia tangfeifanii]